MQVTTWTAAAIMAAVSGATSAFAQTFDPFRKGVMIENLRAEARDFRTGALLNRIETSKQALHHRAGLLLIQGNQGMRCTINGQPSDIAIAFSLRGQNKESFVCDRQRYGTSSHWIEADGRLSISTTARAVRNTYELNASVRVANTVSGDGGAAENEGSWSGTRDLSIDWRVRLQVSGGVCRVLAFSGKLREAERASYADGRPKNSAQTIIVTNSPQTSCRFID